MTNYGWNLPPGTPGPRGTTVEMVCCNPECPVSGEVVELYATNDLGQTYLNNEDQLTCPDCGWERGNPDDELQVLGADPPDASPFTVLVRKASDRDYQAVAAVYEPLRGMAHPLLEHVAAALKGRGDGNYRAGGILRARVFEELVERSNRRRHG